MQVSVAKLHADEPKEYTKVLFWVEDALGNKDSCLFIGTPTATDGIDEHLGEVNLYGVPPTKELDIRIVQRTDNNKDGYWLYGIKAGFTGDYFIKSSEQNIDLKVDYRWLQGWDTNKTGPDDPTNPTGCGELFQITGVVLKVTATNYPVKIYVGECGVFYCPTWYSGLCYSIHNEKGYCIISNIIDIDNPISKSPFYCINSAEESFWINTNLDPLIGVKDSTSKIFITPNPAFDYVLIEGLEDLELQIFDVIGNFVCSFTPTENPYKLSISNLVDGTYFLTDKKNQLLGKFIKGGR